MSRLDDCDLLLFVPGDRPDRFARAVSAGADGVIIDWEDSVAANDKDSARETTRGALAGHSPSEVPIYVRINSAGTRWHEADVAAVVSAPVAGIVLAKSERIQDLQELARSIGGAERIIALIETPTGLACARQLAEYAGRLAFGSIDYAAALCMAHSRDALLSARAEIVLASRLAGRMGPIDGVTLGTESSEAVLADAAYASSLGFSGKLLIHPDQVDPARRGFQPTGEELAWAQRILAASTNHAVAVVDGLMVDLPVRLRAEQILRRAGLHQAET